METNADTESPITRDDNSNIHAADGWQHLIDQHLTRWEATSLAFDDEGIEPPSWEIIRLAIHLAERCRDLGWAAPDCVVPDPNGGIVFERRENGLSEVLHVWDDGTVERQLFRGTRLVERETQQIDLFDTLAR